MRLMKLRQVLAEQELDALLIGQPENRRYLTGFTGSAGLLLVTASRAVLATDFRYYEQVAREAPNWELARITDSFQKLLPDLLVIAGVRRLGFESQHVTVDQLATWTQVTSGVEWVPLKDTVESVRMVKDEIEIDAMRRSAALTDAALAHALEIIRPGMTELQVAWLIESYMRTHGAGKVAFDLIVAAGPNGALPHAHPGDGTIHAGEPIVFDLGCVVDGYCSDLTRTVCLGEPSDKYLAVFDIVLRAQQAAEAAIRPGVTGVQADAVARDLIAAAGYGDRFGHGLGHGVGLAVHEKPGAGRLSTDTLQAGMSLTVEPGIYLPGEFGVRIEDLVIIRDGGVEILSGAPKQAVVQG